ncbi:MAG TPA: Rap1a/Tai family immunity protein [Gammaproteobacteria bacterium]
MLARHCTIVVAIAVNIALVFAPTTTKAASSYDWVSDREIASYCSTFLVRPETPSGTVCLSYVQGFLDGLRTTEVPARHELEFHVDDVKTKDAIHESAVRMDALVEEFGPAARAGICLPEGFSEEEIVRVVARELRHGSSYTRAALDDYAQAALQERYPCDISDPVQHDSTPVNEDDKPQEEPEEENEEDNGDDVLIESEL